MKSITVQKLDEAKYFHKKMVAEFKKSKKEYIHYLNAFLNASRNVTFVLQKEYADTAGFDAWYEAIKGATPADFRDFIQIRNISIKEKSIEPYLLSGQINLFPSGLKIPAKSSAEIALYSRSHNENG